MTQHVCPRYAKRNSYLRLLVTFEQTAVVQFRNTNCLYQVLRYILSFSFVEPLTLSSFSLLSSRYIRNAMKITQVFGILGFAAQVSAQVYYDFLHQHDIN